MELMDRRRKDFAMRLWLVLVFTFIITACTPQITASPVTVVEMTVEAFVEPTATPDCLHAEGVTLNVRRISDTGVELHVSGLQPGEIPYITNSTFSRSRSLREESGGFVNGADAQGEFIIVLKGLIPLEGEISSTWDIRFIHARGVECVTVTLP
jgi:hypothetical protein